MLVKLFWKVSFKLNASSASILLGIESGSKLGLSNAEVSTGKSSPSRSFGAAVGLARVPPVLLGGAGLAWRINGSWVSGPGPEATRS